MKKTVLIRKIHFWTSLVVTVPLLIVTVTGLALMVKKQSSWIQAPELRGSGGVPAISYESLLSTLRSDSACGVAGWHDISRIDVRPSKGISKVITKTRREIQVDMTTGKILQIAHRNSDIIEEIHSGDFFGPWVKFGIVFVVEIVFFVQILCGIYLFVMPFFRKKQVGIRS